MDVVWGLTCLVNWQQFARCLRPPGKSGFHVARCIAVYANNFLYEVHLDYFSTNKNTKCPIDSHCHRNCRQDLRVTKDCIELQFLPLTFSRQDTHLAFGACLCVYKYVHCSLCFHESDEYSFSHVVLWKRGACLHVVRFSDPLPMGRLP